MSCRIFVGSVFSACLLIACAHGPRPIAGPPRRVEMEPMKIEVVRGPGRPRVEAYDAATLFEEAGVALRAQRFAEAAAAYDRILKEFPGSRFEASALYNAGLSHEGQKRFADAAERYQRLVNEQPDGKDRLDALFRLGACYAEIQRWPESEAVFSRVLARADLGLSDRVEAQARRGLAQFEQGQLGPAERSFQDTLAHFRANEASERLETDFYPAMAQFYLAHVQHRHFHALPLRTQKRELEQDVEAKAKLFLVAQARYIETIRCKNPVWATAAGFQIGALYKEMYDFLLNAPVPAELDTDLKRQVYFDLLKDRLRGLLLRARRIHEKNIAMAERVGVDNDWVRRSGEQLDELSRMLEVAGTQDEGAKAAPAPAPLQVPSAPVRDERPRQVL